MEVMSPSFAVNTPQAITRPRPLSADGYQQYLAPASQESVASVDSAASSQERVHDSSSNVSQLTSVTDVSLPIEFQKPPRPAAINTATTRVRTPEDRSAMSPTSPMSITSPMSVNGAKRTASGHVKNAFSYSSVPLKAAFSPRRTRAESMSSTGSRAGELAASLKMRLGYAMAKVQHGWESKNIVELDSIASQAQRYSNTAISPRPTTAGYMVDGFSPPSKRRSGTFGALTAGPEYSLYNASVPYLEPAVDILSGQYPQTARKQAHCRTSSVNSPRTPIARHSTSRPGVVRSDTQTAEAERDALQALAQLGSPHNTQFSMFRDTSQASSSQTSPLRAEFAPASMAVLARGNSDSSATTSSVSTEVKNGLER